MSPRLLILPLLLALFSGPSQAAGPTKEKEADKTEEADAGPLLPDSMRQHGVIGNVPPLVGLPLYDQAILDRMRERLVMQVGESGN